MAYVDCEVLGIEDLRGLRKLYIWVCGRYSGLAIVVIHVENDRDEKMIEMM